MWSSEGRFVRKAALTMRCPCTLPCCGCGAQSRKPRLSTRFKGILRSIIHIPHPVYEVEEEACVEGWKQIPADEDNENEDEEAFLFKVRWKICPEAGEVDFITWTRSHEQILRVSVGKSRTPCPVAQSAHRQVSLLTYHRAMMNRLHRALNRNKKNY